jgi:hypothetical protein
MRTPEYLRISDRISLAEGREQGKGGPLETNGNLPSSRKKGSPLAETRERR